MSLAYHIVIVYCVFLSDVWFLIINHISQWHFVSPLHRLIWEMCCLSTTTHLKKYAIVFHSPILFPPSRGVCAATLGESDSDGPCWKVKTEYYVLENSIISFGLCLIVPLHLLGMCRALCLFTRSLFFSRRPNPLNPTISQKYER